jgi:uncharacterized protein YjiK
MKKNVKSRLQVSFLMMLAVALTAGIVFWPLPEEVQQKKGKQAAIPAKEVSQGGKKGKKDEKQDKKGKKKRQAQQSSAVQIVNHWEVPSVLKEISAIAYVGPDLFACVQDEAGTIFMYNTRSAKLEREIVFAGAGDYEGITLVGNTAYIITSGGILYEVDNIKSSAPKVKQFTTPLTGIQNVEGLCYDYRNKRLLTSIKGADPHQQNYKGIYSFELTAGRMALNPVFKIQGDDPNLMAGPANKPKDRFQPSDLAVHPSSGEVYIIDAVNAQLLILEPSGKIKIGYSLPSVPFSQPEGITFSPKGELFISNEGKKHNGNILQVDVDNLITK